MEDTRGCSLCVAPPNLPTDKGEKTLGRERKREIIRRKIRCKERSGGVEGRPERRQGQMSRTGLARPSARYGSRVRRRNDASD